MFTGLIQEIGTVTALRAQADPVLTIAANKVRQKLTLGASVACNGICLTVTDLLEDGFQVQVSAETLNKTTARDWRPGTRVNLEPALAMGDALGGHLLTGHVDTVIKITEKKLDGDSFRYRFEVPRDYARYIAPKGAVTLDGVSLTVNEVTGYEFGVNIIPHTQAWTTFGTLTSGHKVNLEIDLIARYLDRLLATKTDYS